MTTTVNLPVTCQNNKHDGEEAPPTICPLVFRKYENASLAKYMQIYKERGILKIKGMSPVYNVIYHNVIRTQEDYNVTWHVIGIVESNA